MLPFLLVETGTIFPLEEIFREVAEFLSLTDMEHLRFHPDGKEARPIAIFLILDTTADHILLPAVGN